MQALDTLPKPVAELVTSLERAGARYVAVDQPDSDYPECLNVAFTAFSRTEHLPTTDAYVECHLAGDEVSSFAVARTHDNGHRDTVVSQGKSASSMIDAAVSVVECA